MIFVKQAVTIICILILYQFRKMGNKSKVVAKGYKGHIGGI